MTAPQFFPQLPGIGWSVLKTQTFDTRVVAHVSGREARAANWVNPIWKFEINFEALDSSPNGLYPGAGPKSLQLLMAFVSTLRGRFGRFLFADPTDSLVTNGYIGTGDGSTKVFPFIRYLNSSLGGGDFNADFSPDFNVAQTFLFPEPVGWVTQIVGVWVNGVQQASGWSLAAPNSLVFTAAPATGALITATFTFAFVCRLEDDAAQFEQFMQHLWRVQKMAFRSVRV